MKIRPLHDRILVKRIDEEEKTSGGIIIPDSAKEKPQEGRVVAVGNGKVADDGSVSPLDVKKGDKILFSKYSGSEVMKHPPLSRAVSRAARIQGRRKSMYV